MAEIFGVLTDIDVQATIKTKLGSDGRPSRILGACNPPLAHPALRAEPDIGQLVVGFMNPMAVLQMTDSPVVAQVVKQMCEWLQRVRASLPAATASARG